MNGGGTIDREYAIGSGRLDICVTYRKVVVAMELKVWRKGEKSPLARGLAQLDNYLAGLSLDTGWLVIFDRRTKKPIEDRTRSESVTTPAGREVTLIWA